jgi:hypothetical protein
MLNREEVKLALQNSDIYIFLSHFEGCPNALLEAMVSGCVPVSWNIPGITDYLIDDKTTGFLSDMRDYGSMTHNIKLLHFDRKALVNLKFRVRENSQMRFSNKHCVNQYMQVFENAMNLVNETGDLSVPLHLRNAPTKLMKELNYGKEYKYAHQYESGSLEAMQEFLPNEIAGTTLYNPSNNARENELRNYLRFVWRDKYGY